MNRMKYKDYMAKLQLDVESGLIYGRVVGARDVITFQGETIAEAEKSFRESVDFYLSLCAKQGREPDKPYNGVISYRTKPERHRAIQQAANSHNMTINEYIDRVIARRLRREQQRSRAPSVKQVP